MRLANFVAAHVVSSFGHDVCDLVPHFDRNELNMFREPDGVHFNGLATRIMTQFLMAHVADMWEIKLPDNVTQKLEKMKETFVKMDLGSEFTAEPSTVALRQAHFFKSMGRHMPNAICRLKATLRYNKSKRRRKTTAKRSMQNASCGTIKDEPPAKKSRITTE
jgi:hypothetical protein